MNRPLLARRDRAQLALASLPGLADLPSTEDIDPDRFRSAVLRAWESRPIEDRREALGALLDQVTLSEGGIHIAYRAKAPEWGYHYHAPYGPPYGSWVQYRLDIDAAAVKEPRSRAVTVAVGKCSATADTANPRTLLSRRA